MTVASPTAASHIPLFVDLSGRTCLVVGGGSVAARRSRALAAAGAEVTVVAPSLVADLSRAVEDGLVAWRERPHRIGDAEGCALVVAATDDPAVNDAVGRDAAAHGALCNRADRAELGDVVVPAATRRDHLVVAVSTFGASPALAAVVRGEIEDRFGPEWGHFATLLGELRADGGPDRETVEEMIRNGVLEALRDGDAAGAEEIVRRAAGGGGR